MGLLDRWGESDEQLRAQEIREQVRQVPGVEHIAACRPRTKTRVAGIVLSIKVMPHEDTASLAVQIFDGTDEVTGLWLGRRKIPGIELGKCLVLEGTIRTLPGNHLQIINPAYELVASDDGH